MSKYERDVLQMMDKIMLTGDRKGDRTGTGTHSKFANVLRVDISDQKVPLLFSKKIFTKSWIVEDIWFLSGSTNIRFLKEHNVSIWDEWVIPETAEFEEISPGKRMHRLTHGRISLDFPVDHEFTHEEVDEMAKVHGLDTNGKFHAIAPKDLFNYVRCKMPVEYGCWQTLLKNKKVQNTSKDFHDFVTEFKLWDQIPDVRLIAGDIGKGAYGSMWRCWEDTRIVDKAKEQEYYNRGYSFVADVPRASNWGRGQPGAAQDHVVVHRNIDQIADAIKLLKNNPDSRRIIVSAWNPARIEEAALPPCHSLFSFYTADRPAREIESDIFRNKAEFLEWTKIYASITDPKFLASDKPYEAGNDPEVTEALFKFAKDKGYPTKKLSCILYQRSSDTCLGLPFNVPQYALLTNMIAQVCNMVTDEFVLIAADSHIYDNHVELAKQQTRSTYEKDTIPRFRLNPAIKNIDDFTVDDISIEGYEGYNATIPYPVAV